MVKRTRSDSEGEEELELSDPVEEADGDEDSGDTPLNGPEEGFPSPELQQELEELRQEVKTNYDNYLRAVADLDNYKKRALKERSEILRYAGENLARDMVEVLDNLELALAQRAPGANEELLKGIEMIRDQFRIALEKHQVVAECGVGKPFDPNKQQAMATVPSDEYPPGTVIEEFKKTYLFKDKVLRVGQVVVAAAAPE